MRLDATELVCRRGGREVFAGLSFALDGGEMLLLTGPNGAGKTSLLRLVAGLLRATGGRLELTGGDPELSLAEQAHYLGHQDAVKPSLTVIENLQFWARYYGGARGGEGAALDAVGLGDLADLPAGYLSAGQRRRLSLARLLAVKRPIWLLDEPTAALDAAAQGRLADLLRGQLADGGLVMAATHGPLGLDGARELRLGRH
jgi:heme exporter protein A